MPKLAPLPARAVLAVTGEDRVSYLNGLVSNDMAEAAPGRCVWAALLTPQGKWLADFFVFADRDRLLLDVEAGQAAMIAQRLLRFRLRAKIAIDPIDWTVAAAWDGAQPPEGAIAAPDPRLPEAGWRLLCPQSLPATAEAADWDAHRLALGLPDGSRDLEAEKSVLLEAGFDELHGISWTKGCYMGQELTARTRYRGLVKRRLVLVQGETALPAPGTPILAASREVGQMRSSLGQSGLALLRLDSLEAALEADGLPLLARLPAGRRTQPAPLRDSNFYPGVYQSANRSVDERVQQPANEPPLESHQPPGRAAEAQRLRLRDPAGAGSAGRTDPGP